jgi:hypothetical protein
LGVFSRIPVTLFLSLSFFPMVLRNWSKVFSILSKSHTTVSFSHTCLYFVFVKMFFLPFLVLNWNLLLSCVCLWIIFVYVLTPPHAALVWFWFFKSYSFTSLWYWVLNPGTYGVVITLSLELCLYSLCAILIIFYCMDRTFWQWHLRDY